MCGMTKAGIPWIPHQARNDQMTASGYGMTKARSSPAYGRKRKEKWRRGTNVGKRCLSRSESVEGPRTVKPAERLLQSEPGEFFFPGPRSHFSAFGHQPGAFFWLSLFFCGKRKGRFWMHGPCVPTGPDGTVTVFFGYKPRLYPGFRVENRVTPHVMRGPERGRKGNVFCKCSCRYFWIPHHGVE